MSKVTIVFGNQTLICDSSEEKLIDRFMKAKEAEGAERAAYAGAMRDIAGPLLASLFGAGPPPMPDEPDADEPPLD